jgi:DNA polymerase-4
MADRIFRTAKTLFDGVNQGPFRLIGVGLSELYPAGDADRSHDLLDPDAPRRNAAERATDALREKFGKDAIVKGRSLR